MAHPQQYLMDFQLDLSSVMPFMGAPFTQPDGLPLAFSQSENQLRWTDDRLYAGQTSLPEFVPQVSMGNFPSVPDIIPPLPTGGLPHIPDMSPNRPVAFSNTPPDGAFGAALAGRLTASSHSDATSNELPQILEQLPSMSKGPLPTIPADFQGPTDSGMTAHHSARDALRVDAQLLSGWMGAPPVLSYLPAIPDILPTIPSYSSNVHQVVMGSDTGSQKVPTDGSHDVVSSLDLPAIPTILPAMPLGPMPAIPDVIPTMPSGPMPAIPTLLPAIPGMVLEGGQPSAITHSIGGDARATGNQAVASEPVPQETHLAEVHTLFHAGSGLELDLSNLNVRSHLSGIQSIDLVGSADNTVVLDLHSVLDMTSPHSFLGGLAGIDQSHVLVLNGVWGDRFKLLDDSDWSIGATGLSGQSLESAFGTNYHFVEQDSYTQINDHGATVFVDEHLHRVHLPLTI